MIVTGHTIPADFPVTPGAYDPTFDNSVGIFRDGFVTRLSADGARLVYSTYLGGSNHEYPLALALDPQGEVCIAGRTRSADFPTTIGAFDRSHNGSYDGFIARLSVSCAAQIGLGVPL